MPKKGRKFPRGLTVKLACDGAGTSYFDAFEDGDKMEQEKQQHLTIQSILGHPEDIALYKEQIGRKTFYLIHFNILCHVEHNDTFIPIEIGLVEYSIAKGVSKRYHKVIDYGNVPTGYFGAAKMQSEDIHDLLFAEVPKENQYSLMWNEIVRFLDVKEGEIPAVFTNHNHIVQTMGCLQWLYKKTDLHLVEFQVLDLAILYYELCLAVNHHLSLTEIITSLDDPQFDFAMGTRCIYHENTDSQYCALGLSIRQCYLMSESVCKVYNFPLTENHKPLVTSISQPSNHHRHNVKSFRR